MPHTPAVHVALPPAGVAHAWPHAPHWPTSVCRFDSQPFVASWSQSPRPVAQDFPHTPAVHCALPPTGVAHEVPQAPQRDASFWRSVSQPLSVLPSQSPKPALQPMRHAPAVHTPAALVLPGQVCPHWPQCVVLLCRSVSQPLRGLSSQLPTCGVHGSWHCPAAQR